MTQNPPLALALTIGSLTLGLAGLAVMSPAQAAAVDTPASADAHVDARRTSTNFGTASTLKVDGRTGQTKHAFLKFTLPDVPSGQDIDSVTLRLRPLTTSARGVSVYSTGNGWTEKDLKWATKPSARDLLGSSNSLRSGITEVVTLNVADFTPGQVLSLRVETSAQSVVSFGSSEATTAKRPALRVTTSRASAPTTPTPAPTTPAPPPDTHHPDTHHPGTHHPAPADHHPRTHPAQHPMATGRELSHQDHRDVRPRQHVGVPHHRSRRQRHQGSPHLRRPLRHRLQPTAPHS